MFKHQNVVNHVGRWVRGAHCWGECILGQSLWKTGGQNLGKFTTRTPYDLAILDISRREILVTYTQKQEDYSLQHCL